MNTPFISFRFRTFVFALMLCVSVRADLVISEFLASNTASEFLDEDGDSSDWIEIHNTGTSTMSLGGWALTDDVDDIAKWTFPAVSIGPNRYVVLFASGKDRKFTNSELHTNFKLSADGEYLALVSQAGDVVDEYEPSFPEQRSDFSYGVTADGTTLGYFANATPGSVNTGTFSGWVEDPEFSVVRGIFSESFVLSLSTGTSGAIIRYTTDGSTPSASNGVVFNDSSPISINKTTTIRAVCLKAGYLSSKVDTHTYLFPSDVRTQYSNGGAPAGWPSSSVNGQVFNYGMDPDITSRYSAQEMEDVLTAIPSVMLTTDLENLTDSSTGIYVNARERGINWERPAHLEMLQENAVAPVSIGCGIRIRGGASRNSNNAKHSFRIFLRDEYGDSKLEYPLFGNEGADEFVKFDFRTAQNYSWSKDGNKTANTFLREILCRDLQAASGQPYTRSRYYHLYLNGVYWGLFMTQERSEANWAESYLGGDDDDMDTLKSAGRESGYVTEATDGDMNGAWRDLWDLSRSQRQSPTKSRYYEMQGLNSNGEVDSSIPMLLDVDNLIDYVLLLGYAGAYDNSLSNFVGASNNWYSVRDSVLNNRGFVHLMHDGEHSLGAGGKWNGANDRINTTDGNNSRDEFSKSNPQFIHMDLAESTPEYRLRFADRAHAALFNGGYLAKESVYALLEKRREVVDQVIIAESARWGDIKSNDPADKEDWESAVEDLENLIETRASVFLGHLKVGGLYPETDAPILSPFEPELLRGSSVLIGGTSGTIYYTIDGSDPRSESGSPSPTAQSYEISGVASAGFEKGSVWSFDDSGINRGLSGIVKGETGYGTTHWKHPSFNDSNWSTGEGILGFGSLGGETPSTSMGLSAKPITSYLRREFTVENADAFLSIRASVLADDGVIVYLNGVEIFRENLDSGSLGFGATAQNAVPNGSELNYTSFSIDASLLEDGINVFAVELHQVNSTSSDLGFDMDLAMDGFGSTELVLEFSATLKARVLNDGEWSALVSNHYSVARSPVAADILVSEVHYHPSDPVTVDELAVSSSDSEFEFIELTNVSDEELELNGLTLVEKEVDGQVEGVRFVLTDRYGMVPGKRVCIVANREAFFARYPSVLESSVIGEFDGNLGNSGEWIELQNDKGQIIASFRYGDEDPWPTEADGEGKSLQLVSLNSGVDYADPYSWMAIVDQGTPGVEETSIFDGVEDDDLDEDGIPSIVEYYSGSSDLVRGGSLDSELFLYSDSNDFSVSFSFNRNPEAIGLESVIETSSDFDIWGAPPLGSVLIDRVVLTGNLVRETYLLENAFGAAPDFYCRLRVSLSE